MGRGTIATNHLGRVESTLVIGLLSMPMKPVALSVAAV